MLKKEMKKVKDVIVSMRPQKYTKNNFIFTIESVEDYINLFFQNVKDFPVKTYLLKLSLDEINKMEAFENIQFKNIKKLENLVRKCIDSNKYEIKSENEGSFLIFKIISEVFDNDVAEFKIPEKGLDANLKSELASLKSTISDMNDEIESLKDIVYNRKKTKKEEEFNIK